jgi:hypothetical protein
MRPGDLSDFVLRHSGSLGPVPHHAGGSETEALSPG